LGTRRRHAKIVQKHLARAKHMLKEGDNPLDLFMPASEVTAMGNSTEVGSTHKTLHLASCLPRNSTL
jgi:hypothetical protein